MGILGLCAINLIGLIVDIGLGINMIWPSIAVLLSIAIYLVCSMSGRMIKAGLNWIKIVVEIDPSQVRVTIVYKVT